MDSNHRPLPCQGSALDQLSYGPTRDGCGFNSNGRRVITATFGSRPEDAESRPFRDRPAEHKGTTVRSDLHIFWRATMGEALRSGAARDAAWVGGGSTLRCGDSAIFRHSVIE